MKVIFERPMYFVFVVYSFRIARKYIMTVIRGFQFYLSRNEIHSKYIIIYPKTFDINVKPFLRASCIYKCKSVLSQNFIHFI